MSSRFSSHRSRSNHSISSDSSSQSLSNKTSSFQPQQWVVTLFHVLFLTVPFFFTWVNEELFEFNKMLLTYALTIGILASWLMRIVLDKRLSWRKTVFDIPLALFVLSQILSTLFSIHPRTSWFGYYTRFHGGLLSTLTYIGLYYAFVNNVEKKHLRNLFLSIFVAALGVSLYAIPEHFGASPSCALIMNSFDTSCWIQDVKSRVFATFGQPNWLAAYAITLLPLGLVLTTHSFYQWKNSSVNWKRLALYAASSVLLFATLLFTQSRSGALGGGVGFGVLLLGLGVIVTRSRQASTEFVGKTKWAVFGPILAISVVLGILAINFGTPFTPSIEKFMAARTASTPTASPSPEQPAVNRLEVGGTDSGEIRKIVWSGALAVWKRYPLLGSGVETFAYSYYLDRPVEHNLVSEWDFLYNKAHNEFLNFLATTGVVGLSSYVLMLAWFGVVAVYFAWQPATDESTFWEKAVVTGLLAGVIGLSISNFFGFSTVMVTILMFVFMAVTEVIMYADRHQAATYSTTNMAKLSNGQYVQIGLVLAAAGYGLIQVGTMWTADAAFTYGKGLMGAGNYNTGIPQLQLAINRLPNEALYYDELATAYAQVAVGLAQQGDSTFSSQLTQVAIQASDETLKLNSRHLNFYKTRARIFITLAQLDPKFLSDAHQTLEQALTLAPTDAKLVYNMALVEMSLQQPEAAMKNLQKAIELKPNYVSPRFELGKMYETQGNVSAAQEQYSYILTNLDPNNLLVSERVNYLATASAQLNSATP